MKKVICLLNVITGIIVSYFVVTSGIIPDNIVITFILLVFVVALFNCFILLNHRTNKRMVMSIIFSILAIGTNLFISYNLYLGNTFLKDVTRKVTNTTTLSTVVLKDNTAKKLANLTGSEVFVSETTKPLVDSNRQHYIDNNVQISSGDDYLSLVNKLMDGSINSIVIDESMRKMIVENNSDFTELTRVIDKFNVSKVTNKKTSTLNAGQPFNVYLSGVDEDSDPAGSARSDSNLILTINPSTGKILMTAIPRDLFIPLDCVDIAGTPSDKFTHSGIYGVECSVGTLEYYLDIKIDYYARIGFDSFMDVVDALGGITVDNPNDFYTSEGVFFQAGPKMELTGERALQFARERYAFEEEGDVIRVANQQRVIAGILNKVTTPKSLANFGPVLNAVAKNIVTNMGDDQIKKLVKYQLENGSKLKMQSVSLNGTGMMTTEAYSSSMELSVLWPDEEQTEIVKEAIGKIMNGE